MVGNRRFVQVELICNIKAAYGAVGDEPGENIEAGRLCEHIQDSAEQHIIGVGLGENRRRRRGAGIIPWTSALMLLIPLLLTFTIKTPAAPAATEEQAD